MYTITGATGNTGSVVARTLLARGQKVRVLGRSAERLQALAALGAEPFVCEITDAVKLTEAFKGAQGVYAMIPPDLANKDVRAYQERASDALASALQAAGVKHAVSLSSIGADKTEQTGPVVGLHHLEEKLNAIPGLNVLHLRAGYFMENTLAQIGIIKMMGTTAGPLRADLKLAIIATHDIGAFAAEALTKLDFSGQQTRELQGERDLTMVEVATIIGKAIDKPTLGYSQAPDWQLRIGLAQMGMSGSMVDLMLEMAASLNSGYMKMLEPRSAQNTTPTSYETFVKTDFVPRYRGKSTSV
jgi:uncharacterized protein YbjT (DUF2867 family)